MIHAVWGTKNREPILTEKIRPLVIEYIKENAELKKIYIDTINGHTEHLHCLFGLNADISLSKTMQLIKGESSFRANKNNLIKSKFEWADEYFAASVSASALDKVRAYIDNQEQHHRRVTFAHEYQQFIDKYKFESQG